MNDNVDDMKTAPLVVAIVLNWNGMSLKYNDVPILESCLKSLLKTAYKNLKIIVVDSESKDDSVEFAESLSSRIKVIKVRDVNLSYETNKAIRYALRRYKRDKYILWLNNDLIFDDRKWLQRLVTVAESDKKIGIVGCRLLYPNGKIQHAGMKLGTAPRNLGRGDADGRRYRGTMEVEGITGAAMLIKQSVIRTIDSFDENFYFGFEDADFCLRARESGFRIIYSGSSSIIHLEGFTLSSLTSKTKRYTSFYNSQSDYIYYGLKHFGPFDFSRILLLEILGSVISIEGMDRTRGVKSIRMKNNPLKRLGISIRAIKKGYNLYDSYKGSIRTVSSKDR